MARLLGDYGKNASEIRDVMVNLSVTFDHVSKRLPKGERVVVEAAKRQIDAFLAGHARDTRKPTELEEINNCWQVYEYVQRVERARSLLSAEQDLGVPR